MRKRKSLKKKYFVLKLALLAVVIFALGAGASFFYFKTSQQNTAVSPEDKYVAFLSEVYEAIQENYWKDVNDAELTNFFKQGSEKLLSIQYTLPSSDQEGLESMLKKILSNLSEDKKKEFSVKLAALIMANLEPFGRSGLYTQQDEQTLKNRLDNVNPENDLYETLEVAKEASPEEIKKAYEEKLAETASPEEIKQAKYAFEVLSDTEQKQIYDEKGIEPTIFIKLVHPDIAHLYIKKFSTKTFEEFQRLTAKIDQAADPHTLILDLRDNIGGSIDLLPYFLGPFIGENQYAYEFLHQGEYSPYKTKIGWLASLVRYKKVVILINENTKSTAELMSSTLKKYNVGVLVGVPTNGWGTIEKVFKLEKQISQDETYSIFLVHSLTLKEDNQPIEGRGVSPLININEADWQAQLLNYFHYPTLVEKVKQIWQTTPGDFY